jgi:hypothetical protein
MSFFVLNEEIELQIAGDLDELKVWLDSEGDIVT